MKVHCHVLFMEEQIGISYFGYHFSSTYQKFTSHAFCLNNYNDRNLPSSKSYTCTYRYACESGVYGLIYNSEKLERTQKLIN